MHLSSTKSFFPWLICCVGIMFASTPAKAGDIELVWHTIESEHFRITYHDPLAKVAQRLAVVAEKAHEMLTIVLQTKPSVKTEVVLTDDTDFSNGSSTPLPFNTVRLYVPAPDNRSELNDYDDWLFALFVHEYTHTLHLDIVHGLPKWVDKIIGLGINHGYPINLFQPRWFIEGLAVVEETERTSGGRLRSTIFDMYLRMHTLENRFLRLDQITNGTHYFPWGNVPYLYGSAFLRYLVKRFAPDILTKIVHRYGGCWSPDCWIPYGLNRALQKAVVQSGGNKKEANYGKLYQEFRKELETRYQAQKAEIEKKGLTQTQAISSFMLSTDRPIFIPQDSPPSLTSNRANTQITSLSVSLVVNKSNQQNHQLKHVPISSIASLSRDTSNQQNDHPLSLSSGSVDSLPGGSVLWLDTPIQGRPGLRRYDVETGKIITEHKVDGAEGLSFNKIKNWVIFSQVQYFKEYYTYHDLILWDRNTKKEIQLTKGLRTDNPAISPDGQRVAFEVNSAGTRFLGLMELPTQEQIKQGQIEADAVPVKEVWQAHAFQKVTFPLHQKEDSQVYTPAWSPDGQKLAFSLWQEGGYRDIFILQVSSGELKQITQDRALDLDPVFSADGKYLFFVSDRTGVYNLYAYDLTTEQLFQVSNVLSGVFAPTFSTDGKTCIFVGFTADGYRYEKMSIDEKKFWLAPSPIHDRPNAAPIASTNNPLPITPYQPARTLFRSGLSLLSAKIPFSGPGPYGQTLGFSFPFQDLVGWHQLSAGILFSTGRADAVSAMLSYRYKGLWNDLYVTASRSLSPYPGLEVTNNLTKTVQLKTYDEETWAFSVGTSLPLLKEVVRNGNLSFDYQFAYRRNQSDPPILAPLESISKTPEVGRFATLSATWSYSDARRFLYSVSPEQGRSLFVNGWVSDKALGSEYQTYGIRGGITQYISIPWPWFWAQNHALSISYQGGISGGNLQRRPSFVLGGYPAPLDSFKTLLTGQFPGQASLRGYPFAFMAGDQYHLLKAEYRFPIVWIERGYQALPFYFSRLHAGIYSDYGAAFDGKFDISQFKASLGGEIRLDGSVLYNIPFSLQLGYAHGFMDGGENQVYFLINNPL